jgi:hypothetical protein
MHEITETGKKVCGYLVKQASWFWVKKLEYSSMHESPEVSAPDCVGIVECNQSFSDCVDTW